MPLNNVPLSGQSLNQTRTPIRNNFTTISTDFSVDHVDFQTVGAGKHNKITFPVQAGVPVFAAGEEGLYNFLYPTTTKNELFVHKQTNAGTADIPFTASILSNVTAPAALGNGWTYLPSGILLKWGTTTTQSAQQAFPTTDANGKAIPAFTGVNGCIHILVSFNGTFPASNVMLRAFPNSGTMFTADTNLLTGTAFNISYLAIGY